MTLLLVVRASTLRISFILLTHALCLSMCNCGLQLRVPSLFWLLAGDQRLLQTVLTRTQEDAQKLAKRIEEAEFSREC